MVGEWTHKESQYFYRDNFKTRGNYFSLGYWKCWGNCALQLQYTCSKWSPSIFEDTNEILVPLLGVKWDDRFLCDIFFFGKPERMMHGWFQRRFNRCAHSRFCWRQIDSFWKIRIHFDGGCLFALFSSKCRIIRGDSTLTHSKGGSDLQLSRVKKDCC